MSVALVCIAKNEDHYIDEWLQYHQHLQFSDIYVYQNNWRYTGLHYGNKSPYDNVHWLEMDGEKMQLAAYNHFIHAHLNDYDWACFFDVDEFLVLKGIDNVHQYFSRFNSSFGVAVNWKMFGDSMQHFDGKEFSVLRRFKMCAKHCNCHVKACLNFSMLKRSYDLSQLEFVNPHFIRAASTNNLMRSSDDSRYVIGPFNDNYDDDDTYLCHFFGKTWEEYQQKMRRGRASAPNGSLTKKIFDEHNLNEVVDDYAFKFMYLQS